MTDSMNHVYDSIDRGLPHESAHTRRKIVAGAASAIGALGLMGVPEALGAKKHSHKKTAPVYVGNNNPKTILAVAATAEVLATIINTMAPLNVKGFDATTMRNLNAAAREELIHYDYLTGPFGAVPLTKQVWIPDAVFATPASLLNTVIVGDQVFINAYMIGTTVFAGAGNAKFARVTSEFMGVEAVHRAVARQSLGLLGNDRAFIKYDQPETAQGPKPGLAGFTDILGAVATLEAAGIGFGKQGSVSPGTFYNLDDVRKLTPFPSDVNTLDPR